MNTSKMNLKVHFLIVSRTEVVEYGTWNNETWTFGSILLVLSMPSVGQISIFYSYNYMGDEVTIGPIWLAPEFA